MISEYYVLHLFQTVGGLAEPLFGLLPRLLFHLEFIELDGGSRVGSRRAHVLDELDHHVRLTDGLPQILYNLLALFLF